METIKTPTLYSKLEQLITSDFNADYVLSLITPIEHDNVISMRVLLHEVDQTSYTYIYTIKINMEGDIWRSREGEESDKIDFVTDYVDSISDFIQIIKEIYNHKINLPYFTLPSLSKVISDKIREIFKTPIQINDKFVRCNFDITYEYASELISGHIIKYCKENKNESNNENV